VWGKSRTSEYSERIERTEPAKSRQKYGFLEQGTAELQARKINIKMVVRLLMNKLLHWQKRCALVQLIVYGYDDQTTLEIFAFYRYSDTCV
jgi:20S proteasome alpha/beta subunit